jgi:FMN reductase (NADPH)/FMN reductase [NAD(P)H]
VIKGDWSSDVCSSDLLDEPLTEEEKNTILQAAFHAPTAGNMMLYSIIEVEDQPLKDRLARSCDDQPFIAKAPYVLLFLADYQRWYDFFQYSQVERRAAELNLPTRAPQEGDLLLACCDALIAAQNAVIAAESLGIGSCYIGDILENAETHREMFHLPPYALPITLLCFGRPTPQQAARTQPERLDREFIVHQNTYQRLSGEQLARMYPETGKQYPGGAENNGQAMYFRKFVSDFSIEMSRSVREMLKNWQAVNEKGL